MVSGKMVSSHLLAEPVGCSRAEVAAFENLEKELRGFTQAAGVDSGGRACYLHKTQQAVEA